MAASPGSACGRVVFSAEDAEGKVKDEAWKKVVLVRLETSPEDIVGMQVSQGILTVRGGMNSHAAVVARGMGTCTLCICRRWETDPTFSRNPAMCLNTMKTLSLIHI